MFIYLVWLTIFIISPLLVANDNSQIIKYSMESGKIKRFIFNSRKGTERIQVTEFQAPPEHNLYFTFNVIIYNECDSKEKIIVYKEKSSIRNCSTPSNDGSDILKEFCQSTYPYLSMYPNLSMYANTKNVAYLQICSFGISEFGFFMHIHSQGKPERRPIDSEILASLQSHGINLDGCGKSKNNSRYPGNENGLNLRHRSKIIGGQEANPHSYPWMVLIIIKKSEWNYGQCGGTLINNEWVLTAAHCVVDEYYNVYNLDKFDLYLGAHSHTTLVYDPKEKAEKCSPSMIIVHDDYVGPPKLYNDIALIKIDCPATYSETVSPICLPTSPDDDLNEYDNIDVILTGWGLVANSSINPNPSKVLKETFVKTIGNYLGKGRNHNYEDIIYVDKQDSSACPGDSGGPIMFYDKDNENFIQYGVVSGGDFPDKYNCAKESLSVFTFVPKFIKWIIENIDT